MGKYRVSAPDQSFTREFLKEIRERDLVIYDGRACHAVRIIPRKGINPLFEILTQDDGTLSSCESGEIFDMGWTDGLIKQLEEAKEYWERIKNEYR